MKLLSIHVDLDGTLIDSIPTNIYCYKRAFECHGHSAPKDLEKLLYQGQSFFHIYEKLHIDNRLVKYLDLKTTKQKYFTEYCHLIQVNYKLVNTLKLLKRIAFVSLVTNASEESLNTLSKCFDFFNIFDSIVFTTSDKLAKPSPYLYLESKKLNPALLHLALEDSQAGLLSARLAGCIPIKISQFNSASK